MREAKILEEDLTKKMEAMFGFRNIAIHDYVSIDREVLKSILTKNRGDLEAFYTALVRKFGIADESDVSRSPSSPERMAGGDGGHPGMRALTGMTFSTAPREA